MNRLNPNSMPNGNCADARAAFSPYLDGDMGGIAMQAMAAHLDECHDCSTEFNEWREIQNSLASMGRARMPEDLPSRLQSALATERARGTHLAWSTRLSSAWRVWIAPLTIRVAAGTAAALLLVGLTGLFLPGAPYAVEANDEPLGAVTAPHYLYSEVPPQPIEFGRDIPVLVEAKIGEDGRVYDYTIVSGPSDDTVARRVEANLLASVFRPATVFGVAVPGRVMLTYSGVSVRG